MSQRVREIGVRMALGADARRVMWEVVGKALRLVAAGLLVALLPALAGAHALAHLLFVVTSYDAATYVLVSLLLLATSLAASYLPARRATRVAPSVALQSEG